MGVAEMRPPAPDHRKEVNSYMQVGDQVEFTDERGVKHFALVTTKFDNGDPEKYPTPSLNVVYVSDDESQTDQYGRQIVRKTSAPHRGQQSAHGYFWE